MVGRDFRRAFPRIIHEQRYLLVNHCQNWENVGYLWSEIGPAEATLWHEIVGKCNLFAKKGLWAERQVWSGLVGCRRKRPNIVAGILRIAEKSAGAGQILSYQQVIHNTEVLAGAKIQVAARPNMAHEEDPAICKCL